jgi:hypothetical protein
MQRLAESAARIIDAAYAEGPDAVRLAMIEADAYLASFAAARTPAARAKLVELLFERGPRTVAMDQVLLALGSTPKR